LEGEKMLTSEDDLLEFEAEAFGYRRFGKAEEKI